MYTFKLIVSVLAISIAGLAIYLNAAETAQEAQAKTPTEDHSAGTTVETCRQALVDDHFPDVIVFNVLVDRGVSKSDIKMINDKLDADSKDIKDDFAQVVVTEEEPVATNDPLSDVFNYDALKDARLVVFREVMKDYVDDAGMVINMYNKIETERDKQIKECGKLSK